MGLVLLVWLVFGQTLHHGFVNYDDNANVYDNQAVARGLSLSGLVWACTHSQVGHWDPLTTLSHMLDCQLCGLRPGGHHLGNVLLHALAAVLLFLVLWQFTSALTRSAFAAAVFAIHPLRVESVAWITERKDVLSGVFFMLTLAAYRRYTRQPQSLPRYLTVILCFALGLLSKSMLVTLPGVLLLLDFWPLRRLTPATVRHLLREKIPLFALAILAALIQLVANQEGLLNTERISLSARAANAIVSYVDYLRQMLWPAHLTVFYPHPLDSLPASRIALSLLLLTGLTTGFFLLRKKHPQLLVGWLWYLGMLMPVIGLIQSGDLARADRYTYLPQIGLAILITWTAADLATALRHRQLLLGTLAVSALAVLTLTARRQTTHWRDSGTLWRHALACNPDNLLGHQNLGGYLDTQGRHAAALHHHQRAVELNPRHVPAQNNLGLALLNAGRLSEAIPHFEQALALDPTYPKAHNNLGTACLQTGQLDDAITHFKRAVELKPDYALAHANLANAYLRTAHPASAIFHYQRALEIEPDYAKARANLASTLLHEGRAREAIPHFERVLTLQPNNPNVLNNLAWILATHPNPTLRDGLRAVRLAQQANQSSGGETDPTILSTLAAAYAEAGRFPEAIQTIHSALAKPPADPTVAAILQAQLTLYQAETPFRQTP